MLSQRSHGLLAQLHANTSAACDTYYDAKSSCRETMRGRYHRMPVPTSCNGQPVYDRERAGSRFLYYVGSNWFISSRVSMDSYEAPGFIYSLGSCTCPSDAGCKGSWSSIRLTP